MSTTLHDTSEIHAFAVLRAYDYKTIIVTVIAQARTTTGPVSLAESAVSSQQRLFVVSPVDKTSIAENENSFSFTCKKSAARAKLMTSFIHSEVLLLLGLWGKMLTALPNC